MKRLLTLSLAVASVMTTGQSLVPMTHAQGFDDVQIGAVKISETIYMLTGKGGNIGLCVGEDNTFLIDDQFAPLTGAIVASIKDISEKPVQFVLNTHWHGDHTGGNENLAKLGSTIVAHENVRKRMSEVHVNELFGTETEPAAPGALPQITFDSSVTFYMNGEKIHVVHTAPAHTDTDSVVYFETSNVIHTGDIFFNGFYPFIDVSSAGSLVGLIAAVNDVLEKCDEATVIIPGHGPLAATADLKAYAEMLDGVLAIGQKAVAAEMSRPDFIGSDPFAEFNEEWGDGFLPAPIFAETVYDSLTK